MQNSTIKTLLLCWCVCFVSMTFGQSIGQLRPRLQAALDKAGPNDYVRTIVSLRTQADVLALDNELYAKESYDLKQTPEMRSYAVITLLQNTANSTQAPFISAFEAAKSSGQVRDFRSYWVFNGFYVEGKKAFIEDLVRDPQIDYIDLDGELKLEALEKVGDAPAGTESVNGIEPGLCAINVRPLWKLGYTGCGRTVMISDDGVEMRPAINTKWKGYGGAVPASQAWYDIVSSTTSPVTCDPSLTHGTHVAGIMVGLDAANNDTIGVAFGAKWIASQHLCSASNAYTSNAIATFQWAINPDGNASTVNDRPDVINCSWYDPYVATACDPTYINTFNSVEAAGIAIVFSAGNSGSGTSTITNPKNINTSLVNTFCVANVSATVCGGAYSINSTSSRGPSTCGGTGSLLIKPEVAAPGTSVRSCVGTTVSSTGYAYYSGTSMAAPHVSGAIAILKEAFPSLTGTQIKTAIYNTCTDLGVAGEDNIYGQGMVDIEAAYNNLKTNYPTRWNPPCENLCVGTTTVFGCSGTITDGSSPTFNYGDNSNCSWYIAGNGGSSTPITLTFDSLDVESGYDFIYVYDGPNDTYPLLATITGSTIPAPVISTGWDMFVKFTSDYIITRKGFQAKWTSKPVQPTISGPASTCLGTAGILNVSSCTSCGYTFSWSGSGAVPPSSGTSKVVTGTGNYIVTATNSCGSTASNPFTFTINPLPVAKAGVDKTICNGTSTTIGTAGVVGTNYFWSPTTGLSNPNIAIPTATPTTTTNYILNAYNPVTGCYKTDTVKVTVLASPTANAGVDKTICNGASTAIGSTAVAGTTYSWSPATGLSSTTVSNPTANPTATTTYTVTATLTSTGCTKTDQVVVTVNPAAVANAGPDRSICVGGNVILGVAPIAGTTYLWSPSTGLSASNISNPSASPTVTTTYILTATTSLGCSKKDTVLVTVLATPVANAGLDKTICSGTSTSIGSAAVVGTTYSWSPTTGLSSSTVSNPTASPTTTTTYTVTATNPATGCSKTDQVVVTVNPAAVVSAGADKSICAGASTYIGSTFGVVGQTYTWSPSTGPSSSTGFNPTVSPTVTTTYIVTATTTAGCTKKDTVVVTVNPLPVANAGADKSICIGNSTTIGTASAGAIFSYSWTPASGLSSTTVPIPTANPTQTTNYILTVTNMTTGCTKNDTVKVTVNGLPTANAGPDQSICSGSSTTIGTPGVLLNSYAWTPSASLSSGTAAQPTATTSATTTYILTVTNIFGCSKKDTVKVTVLPLPIANAGLDKSVCAGSGVAIGQVGVAGTTYNWTPSSGLSSTTVSNPTASPAGTTTYTLTATITATGCAKSDQVVVTVNTLPIANAGADATICAGSSALIGSTSSAGTTYAWSPTTALSSSTISNPAASPTATTTYILTATATASGCTKKDTVVVTVNALPIANAGVDKTINVGGSTTIGTAAVLFRTYSWTPGIGLSSSTVAVPTASPTSTTTYTLTVTNTLTGCSKQDQVIVTVLSSPPGVTSGGNNGQASDGLTLDANSFNVFPNPVSDVLNIVSANRMSSEVNVKLYNELGQVVYENKHALGNQNLELQIPTDYLSHGIYFLDITSGDQKASFKVMKD